MDYYCASIPLDSVSEEIIVAFLAEAGFDMFENVPEGLRAFIPAEGHTRESILELVKDIPAEIIGEHWSLEFVPDQNWNETWEKSFSPVIIARQVVIRAPFHVSPDPSLTELIIEPKMSFGTGHHPTTALMVEAMLAEKWSDKQVLDMGCGSGVLAILAEKLGATAVLAIDIDDWAVQNTEENVERNLCTSISVQKGNAGLLSALKFHAILANINRNILLHDIPSYADVLEQGGTLFISGFLVQDESVLVEKAEAAGLSKSGARISDQWMMLEFVKQ